MMRELAEEGRNRPLLGGREFVLFGCAIALASLLHAAIIERLVPLPSMALAVVWFAAMMIAVILSRFTRSGEAKPTTANRVEMEVWRVGGYVIGALALSILAYAMMAQTPRGFFLFTLLPPVVFGVYAIAMAASSAAARDTTLRKYAVLSFAFLVMTTLLAGSPAQYLTMAMGALLVSIVPGLELLRRERAGG
ncbi:hypothetical protein KYN89_04470 [Alteriqipengyuania sp. NZ-12B]|uniref:Tripartite tricarboxylate transporter TctB family protein n=1 Tax=Alteriqipengyuania abyssalis TaxID=2860200 RepID=A0ABS7PCT2_9SPHN|nr:hypothetical protein [Alteriqipengyuania abyssalis]MBY8336293.1 hypothetical protein [Alteriqipengyuania abyssalis]